MIKKILLVLIFWNLYSCYSQNSQTFVNSISVGRIFPYYFFKDELPEGKLKSESIIRNSKSPFFECDFAIKKNRVFLFIGYQLIGRSFEVNYPLRYDYRAIKKKHSSFIKSIPIGISWKIFSKSSFNVFSNLAISYTKVQDDVTSEYYDTFISNHYSRKAGITVDKSRFLSGSMGINLERKIYNNLLLYTNFTFVRQFIPDKTTTINTSNRIIFVIGIKYIFIKDE